MFYRCLSVNRELLIGPVTGPVLNPVGGTPQTAPGTAIGTGITVPRAACLLRSRRRTFLFKFSFQDFFSHKDITFTGDYTGYYFSPRTTMKRFTVCIKNRTNLIYNHESHCNDPLLTLTYLIIEQLICQAQRMRFTSN